jgi:heme-degrading monooxygenase HmoA
MVKTLFAMVLALTLTATWLGVSAAQSSTPGQVLRVFTATASPDKRDQASQFVDEGNKLFAATKEVQWFKLGYNSATGEIVSVSLWNSQAEAEAFAKSAARNATIEKTRALIQGEPSVKIYHVSEAKKEPR